MLIARILIFLLSIVQFLIWVTILVVVFGLLSPYVQNIRSYTYLQPVVQTDKKINTVVKENIPTRIANKDWSHVLTLVILFILLAMTSKSILWIRERVDKIRMHRELEYIKSQSKTTNEQEHTIADLHQRIEETGLKSKNRAELLKEFSTIKKELEKTGRNLAFLAIDVVDSTKMKEQEDPVLVESDFNEYHNYIVSKFVKAGYIKASWTPDGVMACFNNTEQAIAAAQDIIDGLPNFNKNVKMMKQDFQVRCGINSGFVYYDDATPLEEFSDRVIDIAGHMQKNASPNSILIAKEMVKPVESHVNFTKSQKIIDSLEAYEWRPSKNDL